jgi:hypothetical protein
MKIRAKMAFLLAASLPAALPAQAICLGIHKDLASCIAVCSSLGPESFGAEAAGTGAGDYSCEKSDKGYRCCVDW